MGSMTSVRTHTEPNGGPQKSRVGKEEEQTLPPSSILGRPHDRSFAPPPPQYPPQAKKKTHTATTASLTFLLITQNYTAFLYKTNLCTACALLFQEQTFFCFVFIPKDKKGTPGAPLAVPPPTMGRGWETPRVGVGAAQGGDRAPNSRRCIGSSPQPWRWQWEYTACFSCGWWWSWGGVGGVTPRSHQQEMALMR